MNRDDEVFDSVDDAGGHGTGDPVGTGGSVGGIGTFAGGKVDEQGKLETREGAPVDTEIGDPTNPTYVGGISSGEIGTVGSGIPPGPSEGAEHNLP